MADLRVELPAVVTVLAPADVCDGIEAPVGAAALRIAPRELMLVGRVDLADVRGAAGGDGLVEDVADAWVSFALEGSDVSAVFARISELELPNEGWIQGDVAHAAAKVLVEPRRLRILVPAMLGTHVEERIRADAAEVLAP